jgi:hypothetical protein
MIGDAQDRAHRAEQAAAYATRLGWRVLPTHGVTATGACTCPLGAACDRPGKHPPGRDFLRFASSDPDTLRSRWALVGFNLAIVVPKHVVVLDCDTLAALRHLRGLVALPRGPVVVTSRGAHLYFGWPGPGPSPSIGGLDGQALDVKGAGALVTLPPSVHVSGRRYAWRVGESPFELALPELPAPLVRHLTTIAQRRTARRVAPATLATRQGAETLARHRARTAAQQSDGVARGAAGLRAALVEAGADEAIVAQALAVYAEAAGADPAVLARRTAPRRDRGAA